MSSYLETMIALRAESQERVADVLGIPLHWANDQTQTDGPVRRIIGSIQYFDVQRAAQCGPDPCWMRSGTLRLEIQEAGDEGWRWSVDARALIDQALRGLKLGDIEIVEVRADQGQNTRQSEHYTIGSSAEFKVCGCGPIPDPLDLGIGDELRALNTAAESVLRGVAAELSWDAHAPNVTSYLKPSDSWLTWTVIDGGTASQELGFVAAPGETLPVTLDTATLNVSALVPAGSGMDSLWRCADLIEGRFRDASIGFLDSTPPTPQSIGREDHFWRLDFPIPLTATFTT